ncbi:crotonobetainyl-CoA:carnitine CoA-transferase CaiB-like acyl-CoA transferase [Palleronia aestuarii]|uniref:Crotonobetainyl-CoA:carnitine CoA-transferase CaiB-like acyl-CoA transferase n=1 Tax=Palleronia aestuarii TaxID=568105 RepID=A0A2W7P0J5_9RHOB|nr:CoA transferase [Palleronia aestuarii]PZX16972.1 crotonobetainyl-CoA:carnitine CoA-transferase CaiB-like acyl-CoA transferase [Palleronia aestuarii]
MSGALDGLVVIDRSGTIAGQYCARLLSDFGAEVWLAEAAPGRPAIAAAPPRGSIGDIHLNAGKRRGAPEARPDIVLCAPGEDPDTLLGGAEAPIAVVIDGFGPDGPRAGWRAPEIVLQAASGMMISNGVRGREPLYGTGQRASYAAGLAAYVQIMASLRVRAEGDADTWAGDAIRVDAAETASAMCFPYALQAIYNGTDRRRGDQDIPAGQVLCRGSWVCLWVYSNRFAALCERLGLEACLDDPRFREVPERQKHWPAFFALVEEKVADRDPEEFVAELQGMRIIAARAYRISELRESPHLAARGYWRNVTIDGREYVLPGPAFRLGATPARDIGGDADAAA